MEKLINLGLVFKLGLSELNSLEIEKIKVDFQVLKNFLLLKEEYEDLLIRFNEDIKEFLEKRK